MAQEWWARAQGGRERRGGVGSQHTLAVTVGQIRFPQILLSLLIGLDRETAQWKDLTLPTLLLLSLKTHASIQKTYQDMILNCTALVTTVNMEMVWPVVNKEVQCTVQHREFQSMEEYLKNQCSECFSVHLVLTSILMLLLQIEQKMLYTYQKFAYLKHSPKP